MKIPDWMTPFLKHLNNTGGNDPQELLDEMASNKHLSKTNSVVFLLACCVQSQVQLMMTLKEAGRLMPPEPAPSAEPVAFFFVELDPETDKPLKGSTGYAVHKDSEVVADGFEYVQYAAMFAGLANAIGPDEASDLMKMLRKVPEFSYPAK